MRSVMYETHTFDDVLGEQLRRAPYLIASLAAHFLLCLMVMGILILKKEEVHAPPMLVAEAPPPPPEVEKMPEDPLDPVIDPIDEPVVVETPLDQSDDQELDTLADPNQSNAESPFDSEQWNNNPGLGGGAGGNAGGRGSGSGGRPSQSEKAVRNGLQWLADHQDPNGYWDSDEFMHHDRYPDKPSSTDGGNPVNDVGLSGLALLAFMGNGETAQKGDYQQNVGDGIQWLRDVQRDDGLFGDEVGNPTLYNHAIATMVMGEAYRSSNQSLILKPNMKDALRVIHKARNDYGAWRYDLEANGDNDSSITGWMVFALKTAEDNDLAVDHGAYAGADNWFASIEDKNTARTGYAWGANGGGVGSGSSRPPEYVEKFPAQKSEALTAVALLSRIFMTDSKEVKRWKDHPQYDLMKRQADLIASKPPRWDENDGSIDMYYWYYGTYALNQWGGSHWKSWKKAIEHALIPNQRLEDKEDNFYGSWDPVGPWGQEGGRVYSTAIGTLILEVYYRYAHVLGAR
ncbi:MAG: prenyltransferase/squalene oxidase repeat-containing protein [Planctomycetota bacterium]